MTELTELTELTVETVATEYLKKYESLTHSLTDQKLSVVLLTANMDTRDACASKKKGLQAEWAFMMKASSMLRY